MDLTTLKFLAAAVAACASLTAVALGIDQLSSGARLRNLESVLRAARAVSDGTERDDVLASLHRSTLARLIARDAVPSQRYLYPLGFLLAGVAAGVIAGLGSPDLGWLVGGMVFASFYLLSLGALQITDLLGERDRIRRWYEQGRTPLRAFIDVWDASFKAAPILSVLRIVQGAMGAVGIYSLTRAITGDPDLAYTVVGVILLLLVPFSWSLASRLLPADLTREPYDGQAKHQEPTWVYPLPTRDPSSIQGSEAVPDGDG